MSICDCELIKAKAYRLISKGSYIDIDGENYGNNKRVQGEILHNAMNLITF